jgi:hypothetical protein
MAKNARGGETSCPWIKRMTSQLNLSDRQLAQVEAYYEISSEYGKWKQGRGSEGAHYFGGEDNPFIDEQIICGNCVFYLPEERCQLVAGAIDWDGLCKLWVIPNNELGV